MDKETEEEKAKETEKVKPSRWYRGYHFFGGACLKTFADVSGFSKLIPWYIGYNLGASIGAVFAGLLAIGTVALGYFLSLSLVKAVDNSSFSKNAKIIIKVILPFAYLTGAVVLAIITSPIFTSMNDEAISYYKKALQIEAPTPTTTNAKVADYNELGNRYKQKGMYDDSIASYKKALQINPKDAGSHYNLGLAYIKKYMYQEAAIETENALKLDPKMADAHRNLGLIYYLYLEDNKKAVYHFKKLLQLAPDQPDAENIKKIIREIEGK